MGDRLQCALLPPISTSSQAHTIPITTLPLPRYPPSSTLPAPPVLRAALAYSTICSIWIWHQRDGTDLLLTSLMSVTACAGRALVTPVQRQQYNCAVGARSLFISIALSLALDYSQDTIYAYVAHLSQLIK